MRPLLLTERMRLAFLADSTDRHRYYRQQAYCAEGVSPMKFGGPEPRSPTYETARYYQVSARHCLVALLNLLIRELTLWSRRRL